MDSSTRDKHFVAWFRNNFLITDGQSELPNHDGDEFVRRVDEIIPLSAGRIREQIAGVPPLLPVLSDLPTVERYREFLTGKRRNRHLTEVRGKWEEPTKPGAFLSYLLNLDSDTTNSSRHEIDLSCAGLSCGKEKDRVPQITVNERMCQSG